MSFLETEAATAAVADFMSRQVTFAYSLVPFIMSAVYWDSRYAVWGTLVVLACLLAEAVKRLTRAAGIWPGATWTCRPAGARNCDVMNRNGAQGGAPGFPSGHTTTAAAFWMGAWLLTRSASLRPFIAATGLAAVIAMAWSRIRKACHTPLQTGMGALLGAGASYTILNWLGARNR